MGDIAAPVQLEDLLAGDAGQDSAYAAVTAALHRQHTAAVQTLLPETSTFSEQVDGATAAPHHRGAIGSHRRPGSGLQASMRSRRSPRLSADRQSNGQLLNCSASPAPQAERLQNMGQASPHAGPVVSLHTGASHWQQTDGTLCRNWAVMLATASPAARVASGAGAGADGYNHQLAHELMAFFIQGAAGAHGRSDPNPAGGAHLAPPHALARIPSSAAVPNHAAIIGDESASLAAWTARQLAAQLAHQTTGLPSLLESSAPVSFGSASTLDSRSSPNSATASDSEAESAGTSASELSASTSLSDSEFDSESASTLGLEAAEVSESEPGAAATAEAADIAYWDALSAEHGAMYGSQACVAADEAYWNALASVPALEQPRRRPRHEQQLLDQQSGQRQEQQHGQPDMLPVPTPPVDVSPVQKHAHMVRTVLHIHVLQLAVAWVTAFSEPHLSIRAANVSCIHSNSCIGTLACAFCWLQSFSSSCSLQTSIPRLIDFLGHERKLETCLGSRKHSLFVVLCSISSSIGFFCQTPVSLEVTVLFLELLNP